MNLIKITNKSAAVKLDEAVSGDIVKQLLSEIDEIYGPKAPKNAVVFNPQAAADTLEIDIHSPGGSVFDGYRLFNSLIKLRSQGVYVTATINSLAASMASVIAMAADKVKIVKTGKVMIHDASGGAFGTASDVKRTADMLETISDEIAGIYSARTGISKPNIREMMKSETWLTAEQAVTLKFADEIV